MTEESRPRSEIVDFLVNYSKFGSLGHLVAAQSFYATITASQDQKQRKLLAIKVYTEYMSAFEDLAALCIAIRHREDETGLIHAYATYGKRGAIAPSTTVKDIFRLMSGGDGITSALNLPALEQMIVDHPDLGDSILPELYPQVNIALAMVSNAYLVEDGAYVRAFNKTKHGFMVTDDANLLNENAPCIVADSAWIIADNPGFDIANPGIPPIEFYLVNVADVEPMIERLGMIRGSVVALCGLVSFLLEHGTISATFHSTQE